MRIEQQHDALLQLWGQVFPYTVRYFPVTAQLGPRGRAIGCQSLGEGPGDQAKRVRENGPGGSIGCEGPGKGLKASKPYGFLARFSSRPETISSSPRRQPRTRPSSALRETRCASHDVVPTSHTYMQALAPSLALGTHSNTATHTSTFPQQFTQRRAPLVRPH